MGVLGSIIVPKDPTPLLCPWYGLDSYGWVWYFPLTLVSAICLALVNTSQWPWNLQKLDLGLLCQACSLLPQSLGLGDFLLHICCPFILSHRLNLSGTNLSPHAAEVKPSHTCSLRQISPFAVHPKAVTHSQPVVTVNKWLLIKTSEFGSHLSSFFM